MNGTERRKKNYDSNINNNNSSNSENQLQLLREYMNFGCNFHGISHLWLIEYENPDQYRFAPGL